MQKWRETLIAPSMTIFQTMKVIDKTSLQFAVVVDDENKLLGTVTDGDIRRGLLNGLTLESKIQEVMNTSPLVVEEGKSIFYYKEVLRLKNRKQLPITNDQNQVVDIFFLDQVQDVFPKENEVIIMAGGLGSRLRPLTDKIPKPMLKVGSKPILETIIESFRSYGFSNFVLAVNYKKEIIQDYFQYGNSLGVNITYLEENKRLGTAGALSLIHNRPQQPFIVINADILTKLNYELLLDFHIESDSVGTMCVREYNYEVPYGVIKTDNYKLLSIEEKPVQRWFVNAGIYVLDPEVLEYIPKNEFFDMPELFKKLIELGQSVSAFPLREYWMDIGQKGDFEKANVDFGGGLYD